MDLVKDDLVRMADAKESSDESKSRDDGQGQLVVPFIGFALLGLDESLVQSLV